MDEQRTPRIAYRVFVRFEAGVDVQSVCRDPKDAGLQMLDYLDDKKVLGLVFDKAVLDPIKRVRGVKEATIPWE